MSGTTDPREGPTGPPPQSIAYPGTTDELEPTPDHGETSYVGAARLTDQVAIITGRDAGIGRATEPVACPFISVSYTHLRAHETDSYLVCRLLLEKKKTTT